MEFAHLLSSMSSPKDKKNKRSLEAVTTSTQDSKATKCPRLPDAEETEAFTDMINQLVQRGNPSYQGPTVESHMYASSIVWLLREGANADLVLTIIASAPDLATKPMVSHSYFSTTLLAIAAACGNSIVCRELVQTYHAPANRATVIEYKRKTFVYTPREAAALFGFDLSQELVVPNGAPEVHLHQPYGFYVYSSYRISRHRCPLHYARS